MYNLAEITVYNLRHNGSSYFCHFSIRNILDDTPIRRHAYQQKRNIKIVKDIS